MTAKKSSSARNSTKSGFTEAERSAMKERSQEVKRGRKGAKKDDEAALLAKVEAMADADRELAEKLHALVKDVAPDLEATTWYGMPAYARDGTTIFFFQDAAKFKARYATLGFSDEAELDQGSFWPTSYALTTWNATNEKKIRALIKRAVG